MNASRQSTTRPHTRQPTGRLVDRLGVPCPQRSHSGHLGFVSRRHATRPVPNTGCWVGALLALLVAHCVLPPLSPAAPAAAPSPAVANTAGAGTGEVTLPTPIPLSDIAASADATAIEARSLPSRVDASAVLGRATQALADLDAQRSLIAKRFDPSRLGHLSPAELDDLEREGLRVRRSLSSLLGSLAEPVTQLEAALARIDALQQLWVATAEQAPSEGFPPTIVDRIAAARSQLDETRGQLRTQRDQILALQGKIGEQQATVGERLLDVQSAMAKAQTGILRRDQPVLWRAAPRVGVGDSLRASLAGARTRLSDDLFNYLIDSPEALAGQLVVTLAILAVMLTLQRRSRRWPPGDPALISARLVLERPFAATFLLATLAAQAIFVYAPSVVDGVLILLAAASLLRLMRHRLFPAGRLPVVALIAAVILDTFRQLVATGGPVERVVLLIEALLLAIALVVHRRRAWPLNQDEPPLHLPNNVIRSATPRTRRQVFQGLQLLLTAPLVVVVVTDVLGFTPLARLLMNGTLVSLFLLALALTFSNLLDAVVVGVLRARGVRQLAFVQRHGEALHQRIERLLRVLLVLGWVAGTLDAFRILPPVASGLAALLGNPLEIGTLSVSLGGILTFALVLMLTRGVARAVKVVLQEDVLPRLDLPRGVPNAISWSADYAILTLGLVVAISAAGVDLGRLSLVIGAFGVGIGFGLQNIVNNFVSGLILIFERPVGVGDLVQIGAVHGEVKHIGIRSSRIRTFEGAEMIVPNGDLISQTVTNWTFSDPSRRFEIPVGVAYGTDPRRVLDLLVRAAGSHPDVLVYPPPVALFTGFGQSSLDFVARAWTTKQDAFAAIRSDVALAIHDALRDAGIEIPFPQHELRWREPITPPSPPAPSAAGVGPPDRGETLDSD